MTVPGPLPWLQIGGVEVGNAARVMEYMRALSPVAGSLELAARYPCEALYAVAGTDPNPFVDVSLDPAPWYDSADVRSTYFLGFIPQRITGTMESTIVRAAGSRFGGIEGGKLGPQHRNYRTVNVQGLLVGVGGVGLDYGLGWLTDVLGASECEQCARQTLEVFNACPDGFGSDTGRYVLYDVGLTVGPHPVSDEQGEGACNFQPIAFTLVAENPRLYGAATVVLEEEVVGADADCVTPDEWFLLGEPGTPHCAVVSPPPVGTLGSIFTITAPSGVGGLELGYFASCPPAADDSPEKAIYVDRLAAGETLVVDSSRRRILVRQTLPAIPGSLCGGDPCPDTTAESDGTGRLFFPDGQSVDWLDLSNCDQVDGCFCARTTHPCSGGGDATVKIETQLRDR